MLSQTKYYGVKVKSNKNKNSKDLSSNKLTREDLEHSRVTKFVNSCWQVLISHRFSSAS